MKQLILSTIKTVIFKFKSNAEDGMRNDLSEDQQEDKKFQIEEIAIKASIEFCLSIYETQFLFTEIY